MIGYSSSYLNHALLNLNLLLDGFSFLKVKLRGIWSDIVAGKSFSVGAISCPKSFERVGDMNTLSSFENVEIDLLLDQI
jgi:hypothetical protein